MRPWRRWIIGALVLLLPALTVFLAGTGPGLRILVRLANGSAGGVVTIGSASGTLLGPVELHELRYDDGVDAVAIARLRLSWHPGDLLHGAIRVAAVQATDVRIDIGPGDGTPLSLIPFSLPLPLTIDTVTADNLVIRSEGDDVLTGGTGRIEAIAWQGQAITLQSLVLATTTAELRARGQMRTEAGYPLDLSVDYTWAPEGYERMNGSGALRGPFDALACEASQTAPFAARLEGTLLDLSGTTTWKARLTSERFALAAINRGWGRTHFTDVAIEGQGSLDDYALQVRGRVGLGDRGDRWADLRGVLAGNWDGFAISDLHLHRGEAALAGTGRIRWTPFFTWQADLTASHLDPALVFPGWPGDLQGRLVTEGGWDAVVDGQWRLEGLRGALRGFPLTAQGEAHLRDNRLQVRDLALTSGRSTVRVNGASGETMDFDFLLDSDNLAELWPEATGRVNARGKVSGKAVEPRLAAVLTGERIRVGANRAERLALDMDTVLSLDGRLGATLKAEGIVLAGLILDSGQVDVQGSGRNHAITLEGSGKDIAASMRLQGGVTDQGWQGALDRTIFSSSRLGDWRQERPATITLNGDRAVMQPFCLTTVPAGSLCVEGSWIRATQAWQGRSTVVGLPLALLAQASGEQWSLEGQLAATLEGNGQQARLLGGRLEASTSGMRMQVESGDGTSQKVQWRTNQLQGSFDVGRLRAALASELLDGSRLHLELAQEGVHLPGTDLLTHPLTGSASLQWNNLAPLTALADRVAVFSGALLGSVSVRGSAVAPIIAGAIDLDKGQAEIPQLGITLSPLHLTLQGDAGRLRLSASARSGEGDLRAESTLDLAQPEHWRATSFTVTGTNAQAANLPGLELTLSPDLRVAMVKDRAEVAGTVVIARARIATIDLEEGITPSGDMVVVDDDAGSRAVTAGLPLHAVVKVKAGDDVRVDVRGLRGRITGELEVTVAPNRPQVGKGVLNVREGSFTIYGRRLNFDVGRLLFAGGPLTNPGIELRSEKKEDGVTAGMVVDGSLARPEVSLYSQPHMAQSAILTRLMESTSLGGSTRTETGFLGEAASMVGLGGVVPYLQGVKELTRIDDIRLETGQGDEALSLVLGSWLTPSFYVSYGKNLLNESGTFNTRYLLGKGFSIKTETGPSQSGGDIKYEFEH